MKDLSDMTLRELVEGFRLSIDKIADIQDQPMVSYEYVSEMLGAIERRLDGIETAMKLAEAADDHGIHSDTCTCALCDAINAYRAARWGNAKDNSM